MFGISYLNLISTYSVLKAALNEGFYGQQVFAYRRTFASESVFKILPNSSEQGCFKRIVRTNKTPASSWKYQTNFLRYLLLLPFLQEMK